MTDDVVVSTETDRPTYDAPVVARAVLADVVAVLVFALVGRASHEEGLTAAGLVTTAWPFVVGVAGGWAGVFLARLAPLSNLAAAMLLVKTLVLGMVLRVIFTDGGAPLTFVVVAGLFLGACFFGWRAVARVPARRRASAA
jgi:hypothetical protein